MSDQDKPLFQGMDEFEREYAPEELPLDDPARARARIEGDHDTDADAALLEPPAAAPVGNIGTSPSGAMAPPNIGHGDRGGGPGDPDTQASLDDNDTNRHDK